MRKPRSGRRASRDSSIEPHLLIYQVYIYIYISLSNYGMMTLMYNARCFMGWCCAWILLSWRGPDGRSRPLPDDVESCEATAVQDHKPFAWLHDPGDLQGRVESRVYSCGQTFLPPISMFLRACSAVQANNRIGTCCCPCC